MTAKRPAAPAAPRSPAVRLAGAEREIVAAEALLKAALVAGADTREARTALAEAECRRREIVLEAEAAEEEAEAAAHAAVAERAAAVLAGVQTALSEMRAGLTLPAVPGAPL